MVRHNDADRDVAEALALDDEDGAEVHQLVELHARGVEVFEQRLVDACAAVAAVVDPHLPRLGHQPHLVGGREQVVLDARVAIGQRPVEAWQLADVKQQVVGLDEVGDDASVDDADASAVWILLPQHRAVCVAYVAGSKGRREQVLLCFSLLGADICINTT